MIEVEKFRQIVLALPKTTEIPHFEKPSFKVAGKFFAFLNLKENRATLKLSMEEQDLFCVFDKNVMYRVPNRWGKLGWTHINLKTIPEEMCKDALTIAYCEVAPQKLSDAIKSNFLNLPDI